MGSTVTAFLDDVRIAAGKRDVVTRLIEDRYAAADHGRIRVFDDETGRPVDLDYWDAGEGARPAPTRVRGRPRLGVVAREVTLLPRQWEWLSTQPGGASAALRRLVDAARRGDSAAERRRRDAAYHFLHATSGDRPAYEEALRALYRGEEGRFSDLIASWPADIRAYAAQLLGSV
jgi:uncharacterized protein